MKDFEQCIPNMPLPRGVHFPNQAERFVEHFVFQPVPGLWGAMWAFSPTIFYYDCVPIDMKEASQEVFHNLRSEYYRLNRIPYRLQYTDDVLTAVSLIYALAEERQEGNLGGNNERPRQAA